MPYVDDFPVALPSSTDPANFDTRADAYYGHIPTFVAQLNALALLLSSAAAPPIAIPYVFSTTTTVADPGTGVVRLNNATQTSATALLADLVDGIGTTITGLLDQFDDSTSTVKGFLRLTKVGDETKWLVFAVMAVATPSGYRNITVSGGVGSSASPFANGDNVTLTFVRNGDKGDTGPTSLWANVLSSASLTNLSLATLSSIPTGYADLAFRFDYTSGATPNTTIAASADGVTFGTAVNLFSVGAASGSVWIFVQDYRGDRPTVQALRTATPGASPAGAAFQDAGGALLNCTGGISALRIAPSTSTWLTGTLYQPRAR